MSPQRILGCGRLQKLVTLLDWKDGTGVSHCGRETEMRPQDQDDLWWLPHGRFRGRQRPE